MDTRFDEHFGFTRNSEVIRLLADYNLSDHFDVTKSWYDGYRFGDADVYCPWDVVNYVDLLKADPKAKPRAFWINTSGNDLVKRFVDKADKTTQGEIERLINARLSRKMSAQSLPTTKSTTASTISGVCFSRPDT